MAFDDAAAATTTAPERTRIGAAAVLVAAGGFVGFAGAAGATVAALVVGTWYVLPSTFAFAIGQVALAGLFGTAELPAIAVVELGLLGTLFASVTGTGAAGHRTRSSRAGAAGIVALGGVGGGLAWANSRGLVGSLVAAVALTVAFALAAYGLHRYSLVELGLVGGADE